MEASSLMGWTRIWLNSGPGPKWARTIERRVSANDGFGSTPVVPSASRERPVSAPSATLVARRRMAASKESVMGGKTGEFTTVRPLLEAFGIGGFLIGHDR